MPYLPWRTGQKLGRTIYAQAGDEPTETDEFLGMMESPELAQRVVDLHNADLDDHGYSKTEREQ